MKDAQIFDRRETGCVKVHDATSEVPSRCRKAIRQSVRVADVTSQNLMARLGCFYAKGDLVGDADAVAF